MILRQLWKIFYEGNIGYGLLHLMKVSKVEHTESDTCYFRLTLNASVGSGTDLI